MSERPTCVVSFEDEYLRDLFVGWLSNSGEQGIELPAGPCTQKKPPTREG